MVKKVMVIKYCHVVIIMTPAVIGAGFSAESINVKILGTLIFPSSQKPMLDLILVELI